jgi:hypothetical protein
VAPTEAVAASRSKTTQEGKHYADSEQ